MSDKPMGVDMLGAARDAQWSALAFLGPGSMRVMAPAKVNLFLGVGERRADGRHEVLTVMHALALHDTLHVRVRPVDQVLAADELPEDQGGEGEEGAAAASRPAAGGSSAAPLPAAAGASPASGAPAPEASAGANRVPVEHPVVPEPAYRLPPHVAIGGPARNLRVTIDVADKGAGGVPDIPARENIVFRAADLLSRGLAHDEPCAIDVRLEKAIPHQAGLGGGSADAAAMLLALARAWGLGDDDPRLAIVAEALGADVAFFLQGGCALLDGAGERLVRPLSPLRQAVLLVKPPAGVSTAAAYAAFDADPAPVPPELLREVAEATAAEQVPLANNLEPAAESLAPELAEVCAWALGQPGARAALLCGSGAATFVVMEDFDAACRAAAEALRRGWWARATTFAGTRAAVLPS